MAQSRAAMRLLSLLNLRERSESVLSSVLVIKDVLPAGVSPARGTVVALHGYGGTVDELEPLCRAAMPDHRLVAVEGPKTVTAYTIQTPDNFEGYCWYPGAGREVLELARFGHALACLEELIVEIRGDHGERAPLLLLGHDQGAVLALTLATIMPDMLSGVISICGELPDVDGWTPPTRDMGGLPILFIEDNVHAHDSVQHLELCGAVVTRRAVAGARFCPDLAQREVEKWLPNYADEQCRSVQVADG